MANILGRHGPLATPQRDLQNTLFGYGISIGYLLFWWAIEIARMCLKSQTNHTREADDDYTEVVSGFACLMAGILLVLPVMMLWQQDGHWGWAVGVWLCYGILTHWYLDDWSLHELLQPTPGFTWGENALIALFWAPAELLYGWADDEPMPETYLPRIVGLLAQLGVLFGILGMVLWHWTPAAMIIAALVYSWCSLARVFENRPTVATD